MTYKEKAEKWYLRSLEEKDDFIKFLLLYICLEISIKSKFQHIRDIKQEIVLKQKFYNNIDLDYLKKLKNDLDEHPLNNVNPEGDQRWSGKLESVKDFDGIIEFIIRARNNLFHGDKGLDEKRDLFIIKNGTKILQPLVKILIQ